MLTSPRKMENPHARHERSFNFMCFFNVSQEMFWSVLDSTRSKKLEQRSRRCRMAAWIPMRVGGEIIAQRLTALFKSGFHIHSSEAGLTQKLNKSFVNLFLF